MLRKFFVEKKAFVSVLGQEQYRFTLRAIAQFFLITICAQQSTKRNLISWRQSVSEEQSGGARW
jgi:hypothetical protein